MNIFTDRWNIWRDLYAARNEPENIRPLAELYWRALIGIGLILIVAVIAWGILVFVSVITSLGTAATPSSQTPPILLDRNKLQTTILSFQTRATAFEAAQTTPASAADPSK